MGEFFMWLGIFALFMGIPLASAIWFFWCLSKYNSTIPFTPERKRCTVNLIISGIVAGIMVGAFLTVIVVYAFIQFFV